jgi:hypothetical protein
MQEIIFEPYKKAAELLSDTSLVWSPDIEAIRGPLAYCLRECAIQQNLHPYMLEIAYKLISEEKQIA